MSHLEVRDLQVCYGDYVALRDVSFEVADGQRLCLLGPSGCGKTTSLRVIAGFTRPSGGSVSIAGVPMLAQPPEQRNIGILFQNYALFPHLTVAQNIGFGLKMRGMPTALIRQKVADALALVRLPHAADKLPAQLSGGEQQRVAFARAVIVEPSLLLLDEPFSNLDARLRKTMQAELLVLLEGLDVATVIVTHDQEEAMAIADRIAVMNGGRIEQIGPPGEIYSRPATPFVARFIGESNFLAGTAARRDAGTAIALDGVGEIFAPGDVTSGSAVQAMVRPEMIRIAATDRGAVDAGYDRVPGVVERVQYLGHRIEYTVRVGASAVHTWALNEMAPDVAQGQKVWLEWRRDNIVLFPQERP